MKRGRGQRRNRRLKNRPLTYAEKVVLMILRNEHPKRGASRAEFARLVGNVREYQHWTRDAWAYGFILHNAV